jgi:hypothetical protein
VRGLGTTGGISSPLAGTFGSVAVSVGGGECGSDLVGDAGVLVPGQVALRSVHSSVAISANGRVPKRLVGRVVWWDECDCRSL